MPRGSNAQLAVNEFNKLATQYGYTRATAWKGIATLLMTCEVQKYGQWQPSGLTDCVIYKDANDFEPGANGALNATIQKGQLLATYMATELNVPPNGLCSTIGSYWRIPSIRPQQQHNLVGHAFRSLCVHVLEKYGDPAVRYEEEVSPFTEFPGHDFPGASPRARIDVVARRGPKTVAIMSSKWRFRHDRVEFIEEGFRYVTAARRHNPNCQLYALTGEFSAARLDKIIHNAPPISKHGPLSAAVHFAPQLLWNGTGENGRTSYLKSLEWLAQESFSWI